MGGRDLQGGKEPPARLEVARVASTQNTRITIPIEEDTRGLIRRQNRVLPRTRSSAWVANGYSICLMV